MPLDKRTILLRKGARNLDCNICKEKPMYPYNKCCFNCSKDASKCDVWHKCGENCEEWHARNQTNFERIKSMTVNEMADFLTSLLDGENNHNVGCYDCMNYGTHHSDPQNKDSGLYECGDCYNEGVGLNLVKWLNKEAESQ